MNTNFIIWQPVSTIAMRFAIESDYPHALQRARLLFAPWIIQGDNAKVARRWRIDVGGTGDESNYSVSEASQDYFVDGAPQFDWRVRPLGETLTQIEYSSLGHLVAHLSTDYVGLHAALLSREFDGKRRAVIIVGPKEAGKSTLACALWHAGWKLHCDDYTLLDERGLAQPTARRVSLRPGARELLGEELWQSALQTPSARISDTGVLFHPHEIEGQSRSQPEPMVVGAICLLKRRDFAVELGPSARLGSIEAALSLLSYSNLLLEAGTMQSSSEFDDWGVRLAKIAAVTANIPIYDLGRAAPAVMVREVERLVGENRGS